MADANFNDVVNELQKVNDNLSGNMPANQNFKQGISAQGKMTALGMAYHEKSVMAQEKTNRNLEKLLTSAKRGELGGSKYDEINSEYLKTISEGNKLGIPLDPKKHEDLLFKIAESLQGTEQTFDEKIQRFITNNVLAFTNVNDALSRLVGDNVFEKKRRQAAKAAEDRALFREEENYRINALTYKFFITDLYKELKDQTDALQAIINRTPTLAQQEEDKMEAMRMSKARGQTNIEGAQYLTPEQSSKVEDSFLNTISGLLLGAGAVVGGKSVSTVASLGKKFNSKVSQTIGSFTEKLFGQKGIVPTQVKSITDAGIKNYKVRTTGAPSQFKTPSVGAAKTPAVSTGAKNITGAIDDAVKAVSGKGGPIFKAIPSAVKTGLGLVGTGIMKGMSVIATAAAAKDVFDIASADTSDDVRDKVMVEDIAATAGSIIGGGIGFFLGGPGGALLGVSIGNIVGEQIGQALESPDFRKEIVEIKEDLEASLATTVGVERDRLKKKLERIQKVESKEGAALQRSSEFLDKGYAEIERLQDEIETAEDEGNTYLVARLRLQVEKAKQKVKREEKLYLDLEKAYNDAMAVTSTEALKTAGRGGFLDRIFGADIAGVSFIANLLRSGDTSKEQALFDVARIQKEEKELDIMEEFENYVGMVSRVNAEKGAELAAKVEAGLGPEQMVEMLKNLDPSKQGVILGRASAATKIRAMNLFKQLEEATQALEEAKLNLKNSGGTPVSFNDNSNTQSINNSKSSMQILQGAQRASEKFLQLSGGDPLIGIG